MVKKSDLTEYFFRGIKSEHNLKIGAIADLISWRRHNETLVTRIAESSFESEFGGKWRLLIYRNDITDVEHLVMLKGQIDPDQPTLVRRH